MRIIQARAEENLVLKLRTGLHLDRADYVLHIRGGALSQKAFDVLAERITRWIGEAGGEIYICHDRDLFVFSPHLSPKVFAQFKEHFQLWFNDDPSAHASLLSFYDIENSGLGLIDLAEVKLAKKIEAQRQEAEKQKIESKAEQVTVFLNMNPDPGLADSLDKRRRARAGLEVLIVEDDPFSRRLIGGALSGYGISFAQNGCEAVTGHLQKSPDIVFLDIDLPDVTGHDVLRKILSFDPDAYIVMLSGNSQIENVKGAIRSGAKGFIGKPFTKEKLLQYIAKCSESHHERTGA